MIRILSCLVIFYIPLYSFAETLPKKLPNIIILFTDDQGYGDVGCFGAKDLQTPHLDQLAKDGTRFTSFYVAQPVCTASRAALLTGCYSNRVSMSGALNHTSKVGIHAQETLLSELCKQRGYATAIYGKWHLGHEPEFLPTKRGFDHFVGIPYSNDNGPLHPVIKGIPALPLYENDRIIANDPDQSQFTKLFTEKAIKFIEANKDRPFFLYVPHVMPHVPIFASKVFHGKSKRGVYGDVIEELDWSVGEIIATLQKHQLEENTLVIFASDNGPFLSYGEHAGSAGPLREGKLTTFEGGVRVPCIMRWPNKISAGRVCDSILSTIDLLPTIAQLIDAPLPKQKIDGLNQVAVLLNQKDAKERDTFLYYSGQELHAVRHKDWKLHLPHEYLTVAGEPGKNGKPSNHDKLQPIAIEQSGIRGIASRHGYRVEKIPLSLFHLKEDVGEKQNLADQQPEIVKKLMQIVEQARNDLGDDLTQRKGQGVRPCGVAITKPSGKK